RSACSSFTSARSPLGSLLGVPGLRLATFSALGGGFLQFPIGDRRCNRTRASVGNAGGEGRPSLSKASERHSPPRFIAPERLRGRVRRRARGGLGRVGFLLSTFHVVHHSMIPLRPPHRG